MVTRIQQEGKRKSGGSVLFAVMQLTPGTGLVYPALQKLHAAQNIFSYGISDTPGGISLYAPGKKTGVLVTGKPVGTHSCRHPSTKCRTLAAWVTKFTINS
jgi:hypothetical protein